MKLFRTLALAALVAIGLSPDVSAQLSPLPIAPYKNLLVCGDMGACPWQAGTANVGGNIANTGTYTADQWAAFGGASSSINVSQINTAAQLPAGFNQTLKFQRTSGNANTAAVNLAQILETQDTVRLQGQNVTLSFWMGAGANFSGTAVVVNFITGTGTNEGLSSLVSGTWTGQATTCTQSIPFTSTSTLTRYQPGTAGGPFGSLTCAIPATATELAVEFQWVPIGTAGTNDFITLDGIQLEAGSTATTIERRSAAAELALAQRYFYLLNDNSATIVLPASCVATSTTAILCAYPNPVTMRAAPTLTFSATTIFAATCGSTANGAITAAAVVASSLTTNSFGFTATVPTTTAGFGCILTGKNTAATLSVSARL